MSKKQKKAKNKKRWFEIKNAAGESATVRILDEIGGWGVWASDLIDQLDGISAPHINLEIFSPGGYVDEGLQIYAALLRHPARITARIDALAASIASVIAMAADEIVMSDVAMMMIHDPWGGAVGTAEDMRKTAEVLDKMKGQIVGAYAKQTGLSTSEIESMMAEETWMTAEEAVAKGFAHKMEVLGAPEPAPSASFAGKIVAGLKHIPETVAGLLPQPANAGLMLSPVAMARIVIGDTESATTDNLDGSAAVAHKNQEEKEVAMDTATQTPAAPNIDVAAVKKDAIRAERERINEIEAIANGVRNVLGDRVDLMAREASNGDVSVEDFRASIIDAVSSVQSNAIRSPLGLDSSEASEFRFTRLFAALHANKPSLAPFELEVCEAMNNRAASAGLKPKGTMIPVDVLLRPKNAPQTTTTAAPSIQTEVLASSFVELLRNQMVITGLGATVLDGLEGNVSIPRQTTGATAAFVTEGGAATDQAFGMGSLSLTPKSVTASYLATKQMLLQSSLSMEALLRNDLAAAVAEAIQGAAISGDGIGANPLGLLNTTGVNAVVVGGVALANIDPLLDMVTKSKQSKTLRGSLGFLTNALVEGAILKLKETTGGYLIQGLNNEIPETGATVRVRGYQVATSEQVPSNLGAGTNLSAAIFGNWNDLLIGEWGALDVLVNPYSNGIGNLKIEVLQFVDCGVRRPASFAVASDILA